MAARSTAEAEASSLRQPLVTSNNRKPDIEIYVTVNRRWDVQSPTVEPCEASSECARGTATDSVRERDEQ